MKKYLIISLFACLLAACGGAASTSAADPALPVVTDPDQIIEVEAGEKFNITLETNPNSGLHWEIALELDTAVVDYDWKEFVAKSDRENSPGWDVWTFRAVAPGEAAITLGYYRGLNETASRTLVFKIIVR